MTGTAIRVENLSKKFIIGSQQRRHDTLRDWLMDATRRLRKKVDREGETEFWALRDVSFEVKRGEVVGVIGRNGAGKSTLLKILSRITEPTSGRAVINGRVGSLLEVGTGFHPELTGRENIYLNGAILGMKREEIRRKFDEIVDFSEIEKFLDTPVKHYSSGMYVRLAFAVAAHLEPEILLVDEVLAVGDVAFQKKCLGKMGNIAGEGRTVMFVSHNMSAIQRLCMRTLVIKNGREVNFGNTGDVIPQYVTENFPNVASPGQWISLTSLQRNGSGELRFEKIRYEGNNSTANYAAITDGAIEFVASFELCSPMDVDSVALTFYDHYGNKLINMDTLASGIISHFDPANHYIQFRIPRLNLNPGIYTIGLWAANIHGAAVQVLDHISAAFDIEIINIEENSLGYKTDGLVACEYIIQKPANLIDISYIDDQPA